MKDVRELETEVDSERGVSYRDNREEDAYLSPDGQCPSRVTQQAGVETNIVPGSAASSREVGHTHQVIHTFTAQVPNVPSY